jgi:hypothetical protein
MRLRFAAIVLTAAASGVFVPARAGDTAPAGEAKAADLTAYVPAGSGFYVHINVRQFLAAPVIRKAIPMAVDKYGEQIMNLVQLAKAFDPNAAAIPNEQVKAVVDELKKPATIANAFDTAKDALTDVVISGVQGDETKTLIVFKCHEVVTPDMIKGFLPLIQGNPQVPVKIKAHEKGDKAIYEVQAPQQPQAAFIALPEAGVVCLGMSKDVVENAVAKTGGGLKADLKKLVAERKKTDFVFVAATGKGDESSGGVVSGWGRLVLAKDITAEMSATYSSAEKAAAEAKEMNEHIAQAAETVKGMLGAQGKDVGPAIAKTKAVASGSTVSAKFSLPGETVEKLLAKDKE